MTKNSSKTTTISNQSGNVDSGKIGWNEGVNCERWGVRMEPGFSNAEKINLIINDYVLKNFKFVLVSGDGRN